MTSAILLCRAAECAAKEQTAAAACIAQRQQLRKRVQAARALEASRLRKARAARVEKLKVCHLDILARVQAESAVCRRQRAISGRVLATECCVA